MTPTTSGRTWQPVVVGFALAAITVAAGSVAPRGLTVTVLGVIDVVCDQRHWELAGRLSQAPEQSRGIRSTREGDQESVMPLDEWRGVEKSAERDR